MHKSSAMPKGSRKVSSAKHVIDKVTLSALVNHARSSTLLTKVAYSGNTEQRLLPSSNSFANPTRADSDDLRSTLSSNEIIQDRVVRKTQCYGNVLQRSTGNGIARLS